MRNKVFNILEIKFLKRIFLIFLIGFLLLLDITMIFTISTASFNYFNQNLKISSENGKKEQTPFPPITLNDSISFDLDSNSYCNEVYLNFTNINETRDFIKNGELNFSSDSWNALNESDINYEWKDNGPEGAKCISINLTGTNSKKMYRPMKNLSGIEDFENTDGWFLKNNRSLNFTQAWDSRNYYPDSTGSLMHRYTGNLLTVGMANSTYQFNYTADYHILAANLSFTYYGEILPVGFSYNGIEVGVYIITPSKEIYLIDGWKGIIYNGNQEKIVNKTFSDIANYFNDTGVYNLTFYSIHMHNGSNFETTVWFDNIELNISWGFRELTQNDSLYWNQSINFDRAVFLDGDFNFSCYITEKFAHVNSSNIFLSILINKQQYNINSLKNIINNTWIENSVNINKSFIVANILNISLGLFYNETSYIFQNETFSIFFDNISFKIGANPKPSLIDLKVYSSQLNKSFSVERDLYNNDFVKIYNESYIWGLGTNHILNLTCNSSEVVVDLILTYFILKKDNGNGDSKRGEPINNTIIFLIIILMLSLSSYLLVIRFQKRIFLNPNYDYTKKLRVSKKIIRKGPETVPAVRKKKCSSCGRWINATAQFCERCGQPQ